MRETGRKRNKQNNLENTHKQTETKISTENIMDMVVIIGQDDHNHNPSSSA